MDGSVSKRILALAALFAWVGGLAAAEFTTDQSGGPKVTFVKLMYKPDLREYWAWVTLEHEDWPIETRRFLLPEGSEYPDLDRDTWREAGPHWNQALNNDDLDRVYTRQRRFPSPYRHAVDWWSVVGPKGERIHKRDIEYPHPGGWPFTLLERGIKVPTGITTLTFKAHDPIHGYGPVTVTVDLLKKKGAGYEVGDLGPWKWSGRIPSVKKYLRSPLAHDIPDLW